MLTAQNLLGSVGPQYKTVNDQGSANALNAQGYQVASYTPSGTEGGGTWLMQRMGLNSGDITGKLIGGYLDQYNQAPQPVVFDAKMFDPAEIYKTGESTSRDINDAAARQAAKLQQSAVSRGLTNNSAIVSLARGVEADRIRSQVALSDSLRRQALDYQLKGLDYQFMAQDQNLRTANYRATLMDKIGDLALGLSQLSYTGQPAATPTASANQTAPVEYQMANPKVNRFIPGI